MFARSMIISAKTCFRGRGTPPTPDTEDRRGPRCISAGYERAEGYSAAGPGNVHAEGVDIARGQRQGGEGAPTADPVAPRKRKVSRLVRKKSAKHLARQRGGPADDGDVVP